MYHNLSISDLMLVEGFKEAYGKKDETTIKRILFENGMDVTKAFEENVCAHRNLRNQHVHCSRYEGMERCDIPWLKGGAASLDAWIASTGDASFRDELRGMSRERNKSVESIEYDSKNYAKE